MQFLRTAAWSELFASGFLIGGSCHLALVLIGVLIAFVSPHNFHLGVRPAANPAEALEALLMVAVMLALANVVVSATGAGVWIGVRALAWRKRST